MQKTNGKTRRKKENERKNQKKKKKRKSKKWENEKIKKKMKNETKKKPPKVLPRDDSIFFKNRNVTRNRATIEVKNIKKLNPVLVRSL